MTKDEIKEQILLKRNDALKVLAVIDTEKRALTEDEQKKYDELKEQIQTLQTELDELEKKSEETPKTEDENKDNKDNENPTDEPKKDEDESEEDNKDEKENRNIDMNKSFVAQISEALSEKRNVNIPLFERRDTLSVGADGGNVVVTDLLGIEGAIREDNILGKFNHITSVNDGQVVLYSGAKASFVGENEGVEDAPGEFSKVSFAPKTLMAMIEVSNKLLANTTPQLEAMLKNDLQEALISELQKTILGKGAGDDDTPKGLLADASTKTTISYADVLTAEEKLEEKNFNNYEFIVSPKVKMGLKQTSISGGKSDLRMVWDNNEIDGYAATSNSACAGFLAIDPKKVTICTWSNASLLADVYTKADKDITRLICKMYVDVKPVRKDAVFGYNIGTVAPSDGE